MKKLLLSCILVGLSISYGCANVETNSQIGGGSESTSYAAILNVNGVNYLSIGKKNNGQYTLKEEIGQVEKKVSAEIHPYKSLESNYLAEGTKLFTVDEFDDLLLAEVGEDEYEIFRK